MKSFRLERNSGKAKNNFKDSLGCAFAFIVVMFIFLPILGLKFSGGLDTLIVVWIIFGLISSYLAGKKNKNTNLALFMGALFGPFAILYYAVCKTEMSEKEKEIYEWELEKKYKQMKDEKESH